MQHVNNDMDDLFRKAGEEYPLHTGMPDWDKMAAALEAAQTIEATATKAPRRNHWRWTLLLLLLPLGWVCNHYWSATDDDITATREGTPGKTATDKKVILTSERAAADNSTVIKKSFKKDSYTRKAQQPATADKGKTKYAIATTNKSKPISGIVFKANRAPAQQTPIALIDHTTSENTGTHSETQAQTTPIETLTASVFSITPTLLHSASYDSAQVALASKPSQKPELKNASSKTIYGGIWASGDITTVHWQRTSKPGWQGGLLAGYRFANRWSVETGISLTRKFYYSEGDYYVSRYPVPPNNKLTEVEGSCTMLEIPINIRYNITRNQQAAWFATAGISSYIMKREDYDLTYLYLNSGNYGVHSKSYKNASRNLFSVLQLSTGYSRQLNKGVALRIEPALRLPLTGLGYGKLRFSSAGLQVGVTKNLWQGNSLKK